MKNLIGLFLTVCFLSSLTTFADVDSEMRAAYEKWDKTLRKFPKIKTTPAYDVVGLLAAMGRLDLFQDKSMEGRDSELARSKKIVLKNVKREQLYFLFQDDQLVKSNLPDNLLIVTDFGEETDDEVTALLANRLRKLGVNVTLLFTTKHFKLQKLSMKLGQQD